MQVHAPMIPDDLKQALEDLEAIATVDEMPVDYRRRAFHFIEQAADARTRDCRVSNFVEVVRFFQQDSEALKPS